MSIYGRRREEWGKLAAWVVDHKLYSPNNRWHIQIPRLYGIYYANGTLRTFREFLENIFAPLFEVSVDPTTHPKLHLLLQQTVGFDCVDDESKPEGQLPTPDTPAPPPDSWTSGPPRDRPEIGPRRFALVAARRRQSALRLLRILPPRESLRPQPAARLAGDAPSRAPAAPLPRSPRGSRRRASRRSAFVRTLARPAS